MPKWYNQIKVKTLQCQLIHVNQKNILVCSDKKICIVCERSMDDQLNQCRVINVYTDQYK